MNISILYNTPIRVLVCKVGRSYFGANGQNHIHFRLKLVLKNTMA